MTFAALPRGPPGTARWPGMTALTRQSSSYSFCASRPARGDNQPDAEHAYVAPFFWDTTGVIVLDSHALQMRSKS